MEHKQENEMDEWMEKMSLCMTRERLDEIQRIATEGMDAWMVRRRRRDRAMQTALAACLVVGVSAVAWQVAPAPRLTAFNTLSPAVAREAGALSIYMLDHD